MAVADDRENKSAVEEFPSATSIGGIWSWMCGSNSQYPPRHLASFTIYGE